MRTVFYHLLKYPQTLQRLLTELEEAASENRLSDPVSWKEARDLPYLDACVKEAGRIHPPFGLPLERVVPAEGAEICGQRFEAGTVVGINAWVVHRDKRTFGEDVGTWRPERWLCEDVRRKEMENSLLTVRYFYYPCVNGQSTHASCVPAQFGAGHRSCIGKHISYLEIYKLVPSMLRKYQVSSVSGILPLHVYV